MMSPAWWSQPFAPEGSVAAEGIANQLGRPALDPLEVLVREAAQNSCDARKLGQSVRFHIDIRTLGDLSSTWTRLLLPGAAVESIPNLVETLGPDSVAIVISDRGTVGLGGPSRAGTIPELGQRSDFVQFIRNVGEPRDTPLGGGTYGFGKGIFYRLSRSGMILVDSKFGFASEQRRVIGAAIGNSFAEGGQRFTGRHWWGSIADDDVPDPIVGFDAAAVASELGLRGFEDEDTGTDIVVVGADLGVRSDGSPRSARDAGEYIVSSILWHLWPKMVGFEVDRVDFAVTVEGERLDIPNPTRVTGLRAFVEALEDVRADQATPFERASAPKLVGQLAVAIDAATAGPDLDVGNIARPIDPPFHHVARMRQAELVVDYFEGPAHPNPSLEYAGVFRVSAEADSHFAMAEPPTHDAWVERGLAGTDRGVIIGTKTFIRRRLEERFGESVAGGVGDRVGLAAFANRLGTLLAGEPAVDSAKGTRVGGPDGGSRSSSARVLEPTRLVANGTQPFLVCRVRLTAGVRKSRFIAQARVKLDGGGSESAAPAASRVPVILQWASVETGRVVSGDQLTLDPSEDSEWWVYASFVPDAMVDITVRRAE